MHRPLAVALVCSFVLVLAGSASAQVCGDATGDGNVTVTDGVQTLRAAAFLSSACTPAACDVDGSGAVTVTDGVNVLRKAASLSAPDACPGDGGETQQVEQVVTTVTPTLVLGFTALADVGFASAGAAPAQDVDECPAGGTRLRQQTGPVTLRVSLDRCRYQAPTLGTYEFDGEFLVSFQRFEFTFSFTTTEVATSRVVAFEGTLGFTPVLGGGFVADGGPVTVTTDQGDLALVFDDLVFDDEGRPQSGSGRIEDTDDLFALASVSLTVTSSTTAEVVATFDDQREARFLLNLATGDFTPI